MADWHPVLACEEYKPGHWVMIPGRGQPYAMIMIVRHGAEVGYRVDTWAQQPKDRVLIGYYTRLAAAAAAGHERFTKAQAVKPDYGRAPGKANTPARMERD
ncbi:MAG: hypothetical protein BGO97_01665 [Micrococcales bacterium 70-64]|nr:hypothetical protein [Leifsonia sp.]ODU65921.1 MAG: hypothetical protein ABT06_01670 [Leifsonia sp. SCN 70-46]OJX84547.1 MAG: hypothetical protein BGO97_01665 [Micrococcales bacterium 70-64]